MQAQIHLRGIAAVISTALLLFAGAAHAQLNKGQQKCVNTANKNAQKIASAQGKDISSCIKDGAKGKLTGSIEACTTSDPKGKVDKAKGKLDDKTAKDCTDPNGPSGFIALADNATIKQLAMDKELNIIHLIFGTDLDTSVIKEGDPNDPDSKANSKCQQAIAKAAFKCQDTKWKEYNSCKKNKLKGKDTTAATSSTELQDECLGANGTPDSIPDNKGKIAKKCDFSGTITKKCPDLDVFPGCPNPAGSTELSDCIEVMIECELCLALNVADGLARDCDEFDEGVANGTCGFLAVTRGAYLQMPGPDQMLVVWHTNLALVDPAVEYGTTTGLGTSVIGSNVPALDPNGVLNHYKHAVQLSGLTDSTKYFYSVGSAATGALTTADVDHAFTTSPPHGTVQPIRIWSFGDSGYWPGSPITFFRDDPNAYKKNRQAYYDYAGGGDVNAAADATDVMLHLGDNAYFFGDDASYQEVFFGPPELQAWLQRQPFFSAAGNHEGFAAGFDSIAETGDYFDMFYFPQANELGTNGVASGSEAYYSFDYGNIHFVILDSEENIQDIIDPNGTGAGDAMLTWLENDLVATTADWIIAAWHRPPYSKSLAHDSDVELEEIGMREEIVPVLEDHGVDLVLGGHSHTYERSGLLDSHYGDSLSFDPNAHFLDGGDGDPNGNGAYTKATAGQGPHEGTVYIVAGSPADLRNFPAGLHPAMVVSLEELGTAVIEVDGDTLVGKFIDETGTIRDAFQIDKGP